MSHEIAFIVALPAGVALAVSAQGTVARGAAIAFAASVAGMFGVSTLFHRIAWEPAAKLWLGRIDHTSIYALIAGTYTPIVLLVLHPGWRTPILAVVWGGALAATAAKFTWHSAPRWFAPLTCVVLGGVALVALPQIFSGIGTAGAAVADERRGLLHRRRRRLRGRAGPTQGRPRSATTRSSTRS